MKVKIKEKSSQGDCVQPLPPALSEFKLKLIQYRVFQIMVRDEGGIENFAWWEIFLQSEGNKEYDIVTKMEQEQWLQLKMLFLLGYILRIVNFCKCVSVCVGGWGELTFGGGGNNFLARGGRTSSIPPQ